MNLFSRLIAITFTAVLFTINYAYSTDQATANPLFANVDTGRLEGLLNTGVIVFKGIHYAAPPIGPLRWRPPQPVHAWNGIHPAQNFGHDCMQLPLGNHAAAPARLRAFTESRVGPVSSRYSTRGLISKHPAESRPC